MREGGAGFRRLCSLRLARTDDDVASAALAREAAVLARLHHPTILPAYDLLEANGWMALVLAFDGVFTIEGLATLTCNRPQPLDSQAALFVIHAVFDALGHTHGKKDVDGHPLVHGDLHPANVLVRSTGHVLLRGFRGAEPIQTRRAAPVPQIDLGPYAAPELASACSASTASDLYGAGAIAWHLLIGHAPPQGETPSLAQTRPDLSPEVASVLDVCLSSEPSRRLLRAATVAATVRKAVDLNVGRDNLERVYAHVLRRLPRSVRDLCAGTLLTQRSTDSRIPTQRLPPSREPVSSDRRSSIPPHVEVQQARRDSFDNGRTIAEPIRPTAWTSDDVTSEPEPLVELVADDIVASTLRSTPDPVGQSCSNSAAGRPGAFVG